VLVYVAFIGAADVVDAEQALLADLSVDAFRALPSRRRRGVRRCGVRVDGWRHRRCGTGVELLAASALVAELVVETDSVATDQVEGVADSAPAGSIVVVAELAVREQRSALPQMLRNVAGATLAILIAAEAVPTEAGRTVDVIEALFANFALGNANAFESRLVATILARSARFVAAKAVEAGL
jgi:hypothetical protein